jgi:ATP-dependent DNA helicase RecQ
VRLVDDGAVRRARGQARRDVHVGVVAVPSRRRPTLVGSLATRIAQVGRLPMLGALRLTPGRAATAQTITVAARALRPAGASAVLPFVLAIDE